MTKQTPEETVKANEAISRPDRRQHDAARDGKIIAGQRAELAANPAGDEGSGASETERAAKRASRNDERR